MSQIERSNEQGRFTAAELRAKVAESKKFWASPEGMAEQRKLDAKASNRKTAPPRFPELAKREHFSVTNAKHRLAIIAKK